MSFSRLVPPLCSAVLATAGLQVAILGVAPSASAAPAPDPATFTSSGTGPYSGTVPDGSCYAIARVVGGAGGHSLIPDAPTATADNGAAAAISARYSVVPGESFAGVVGGGGAQLRIAGTNGGGNGGTIVDNHPGAGGGGYTSLRLDGTEVVVAGGGGGSGGGHPVGNEGSGGDAGLPAGSGVTAGSAGLNGQDDPAATVEGGGGGGPANPGAGGTNSANAAFNGSPGAGPDGRTGGDGGPDANFDSAGGGGGGYFGGGGGASTVGDGVTGGGGGGGASFVAATSPGSSGAAVSNVSSSAVGRRTTTGAGQAGEVSLDFVPCAYDLAVTKTVDDATPAPGDTVTWTVTVTNAGPDPMTRGDLLTIDDTLPGPGAKTITSVSVTGGSNNRGLIRGAVTCDAAAGDPMPATPDTLTCSRPYEDGVDTSADTGARGIDAGESLTVVYTQTIPVGTADGTSFDNVATVTDRGQEGNNTDDATITVMAGPPVATDDAASTPFNTPVSLPATGNDNPSDPGTPLLPAQTVFTSPNATNGGKTLVTPEGIWQVNPNGTVTFTPAAGYVGTTPPVEYRIFDSAEGSDTANLTVTVRSGPTAQPDTGTTPQDTNITVPLLPNDTPGPVAGGTPGTFDPATVVFTSPNATNGGRTLQVPGQGVYTINPVTGAVTFDPEPAFVGPATPVAYRVTDSNGNTTSSTLTITVTATPVPAPTPTPTPVPTPAPTVDDSVDLVLTKDAVSGAQATAGDTVRYKLQVSNRGPGAARGPIKLTDPLPQGLELVSASGKGWKCKVAKATDKVTCVLKRGLGADRKAAPVFVVAKATKAAMGRVVNVAKVAVAGETARRSNNRDDASITVVPAQLPSTGARLKSPGLS